MSEFITLCPASIGLSRDEFGRFIKYLFDDCKTIEEDFAKYSMCHVKLLAEVDAGIATCLVEYFKLDFLPEQFVGAWTVETTRDYTYGTDWDCVDEAIKVEQVTEVVTKTVTSWKPVQNVKQETISPQK